MSIIRSLLIVKRIHECISKKATGNRTQFASKLKMSNSALNHHLREMRILGFPIVFSKTRDTYYYEDERAGVAGLLINFETLNQLSKEEMKQCSEEEKELPSVYYLCLDTETGRRYKSNTPC